MCFIGYELNSSNRAILFQDHYWEQPEWLPKSAVEIIRNVDTYEVRLKLASWFSSKNGFREFKYLDNTNERT
jgi:hypothetical protein